MKVPFEKIEVGKKYRLVLISRLGWNSELTGTIVEVLIVRADIIFYRAVKPASEKYKDWARESLSSGKGSIENGFEFHSIVNPTFRECMERLSEKN